MPSATPPESAAPRVRAPVSGVTVALLSGAIGTAAVGWAERGLDAAAWWAVAGGAVLAGVWAQARVAAWEAVERQRAELARRENELRQLALEKALGQIDALRADLKAAGEQAERWRELEERAVALQSQAALGRLAGGVAHRFNNLLVGIMGYASAGGEIQHVSVEEMRRYLAHIHAASERASRLCFQLMVAAGRRPVEDEVVFLRRFRTELEPLLAACVGRGVTFTLELEPNLPRVRADLGGLQVALVNLVFNALDALAGHGSHLTLTVTAVHLTAERAGASPGLAAVVPGPHVSFAVVDDGAGVAPEVRERIFEPFFSTKPGRLGLGLTAVARWAAQRRGGLAVRPSGSGGGTCAELFLPAIPGSEDPADNTCPPFEKAARLETAGGSGPLAVSRRVLFIDDDETVRELGALLLRQWGCEVVCAGDGHAGEACLRDDGPFGLVLVDYSMPGRDGVETIAALRRLQPDLPVVLVSGSIKSEIEGLARVEPLAGFLQKPFSAAAVRELLQRVLGDGPG